MSRSEVEYTVQEAGCLIYVTDRSVLEGTAGTGPVTGGELYQDDGYTIRVVQGELTAEEQENWTSRLTAEVHVPSGQLITAGILDPDFDRWLGEFGTAELDGSTGASHELGCVLSIDPGAYAVTIHGYPPNDLAAGWMGIEDGESFALATGGADGPAGSKEPAQAYFERTRPGEPVPEWISEGWEDADFLDFVIQLERTGDADPAVAAESGERYLDWEFRKPEICPVGIRL